ncbi:MAG: ribosome hibernation-promoting factor, HPF/YfiA family [Methylovirgula sp.]
MTLRVSGKNIDIGDSLRTYVGARLDLVVLKYAAEPTGGHVTIEREGSGFRTDCTLHLESGVTLQAEGEASDAYSSFNQAADRIENRLRRQKDRSRSRAGNSAEPAIATAAAPAASHAINFAGEADQADEAGPAVIAESIGNVAEMSVSAAVERLDTGDAPIVFFRHPGNHHTNLVYRRADGNIGWIDLSTSATKASSL